MQTVIVQISISKYLKLKLLKLQNFIGRINEQEYGELIYDTLGHFLNDQLDYIESSGCKSVYQIVFLVFHLNIPKIKF